MVGRLLQNSLNRVLVKLEKIGLSPGGREKSIRGKKRKVFDG